MLRLAAGAARRGSSKKRQLKRSASIMGRFGRPRDHYVSDVVHRAIRGEARPSALPSLGLFADCCHVSSKAKAKRDFVAVGASVTLAHQPFLQDAREEVRDDINLVLPSQSTTRQRLPYAAQLTGSVLKRYNAVREQRFRFSLRGDDRSIERVRAEGGLAPKGGKDGHLDLEAHRTSSKSSNYTSMTTCPAVAHHFGREYYAEYRSANAGDRIEGDYVVYLACVAGGVKIDKQFDTRWLEHEISYPGGVDYNAIVGFRCCTAIKTYNYELLDIPGGELLWTRYSTVHLSKLWLTMFPSETVNAARTMLMHPDELTQPKQEQQRGLSSC